MTYPLTNIEKTQLDLLLQNQDSLGIYQFILFHTSNFDQPVYDYTQVTHELLKNASALTGVNKASWLWARGAYGVNDPNENNPFSDFIREYTEQQFLLRYVGFLGDSDNNGINDLQDASNDIAFEFASDILGPSNGFLPTPDRIGEFDAGSVASRIFKLHSSELTGNFSPWAGTILFPYLGEVQFTRDWIFNNGTNANKKLSGTYDLISVAAVSETISDVSISLIAGLADTIANNGLGFSVTESWLTSLRQEATAFFRTTYTLPDEGRFDIGGDLPLHASPSGINFLNRPNYIIGSLFDDVGANRIITNDTSGSLLYSGVDIVHAGLGDDVIEGSEGSDLIDGGDGTDIIDYSRFSSVDRNGLNVSFETISSLNNFFDHRVVINDPGFFGFGSFTDYGYDIENLILTKFDDTVTFNPNVNRGYIVDGGDGIDTFDYSKFSSPITLNRDGTVSNGLGGSDTLYSIERILGGSGNDEFRFPDSTNGSILLLDGGDGDGDTVSLEYKNIVLDYDRDSFVIWDHFGKSGISYQNVEYLSRFNSNYRVTLPDTDISQEYETLLGASFSSQQFHALDYSSYEGKANFHLDYRAITTPSSDEYVTLDNGVVHDFRTVSRSNLPRSFEPDLYGHIYGTNNGDDVILRYAYQAGIHFHAGGGNDAIETWDGIGWDNGPNFTTIHYRGGDDIIKNATYIREIRLWEGISFENLTGYTEQILSSSSGFKTINLTLNFGDVGTLKLEDLSISQFYPQDYLRNIVFESGGRFSLQYNGFGLIGTNNVQSEVQDSWGDDNWIGSDVAQIYYAKAGDDVHEGRGGNDTFYGGSGNDTSVFTNSFSNYQVTQNGDATVVHAISDDEGTDTLYGVENLRFGQDTLTVIQALNSVTGTSTEEILTANSKGSAIYGFGGNDTLISGIGNDHLDGGAGSDRFQILPASGNLDIIADFSSSEGDIIDLSSLNITFLSSDMVEQIGNAVQIQIGNGSILQINNVSTSDVSSLIDSGLLLGVSKDNPGDIDGDNVVDDTDFGILASHYGTTENTSDLNNDGQVNLKDFGILAFNFGSTPVAIHPTSIFEEELNENHDNLVSDSTSVEDILHHQQGTNLLSSQRADASDQSGNSIGIIDILEIANDDLSFPTSSGRGD